MTIAPRASALRTSAPLGLVVFDCDGVLVNSEVIAARVLSRELVAIGFPLTPEDCLARYTGISLPSVVARIEDEWGHKVPVDFLDRLRRRDSQAFRDELRAIPHVGEVAAGIRVPKCVASSGRLAKIRLTLSLTGLLELFDPHLFSAEMVAHGKPAPDLFLFAATKMGVEPASSLVVEDSKAGVRAGLAAGMRVLGFVGGAHCRPGHDATLAAAGAERIFADMRDLPDRWQPRPRTAPNPDRPSPPAASR